MNDHCTRRFIVFRACQEFMHLLKRAPTVEEIAIKVDSSTYMARQEMRALNGAAGLAYSFKRLGKPAEVSA